MKMKFIFGLIFVIFGLLPVYSLPYPFENFIDCDDPQPEDMVLLNENAKVKGSIFKVKVKKIIWPIEGLHFERITCITAIDNKPKEKAKFEIEAGGVGCHYVIMKLTSRSGKGFNFDVTVQGRNDTLTTTTSTTETIVESTTLDNGVNTESNLVEIPWIGGKIYESQACIEDLRKWLSENKDVDFIVTGEF